MASSNFAQTWQSPPEPINQIFDAPQSPRVLLSPNRQWLVELEKSLLPTIALLAESEVPLAGLLLNPRTNAPSRHNPYRSIKIKSIASPENTKTLELPENARIGFVKWSFDSQKLAFTLTQPTGLELWVVDVTKGYQKRLTEALLNAAYGEPYHWLDDNTLICKFIKYNRGLAPTEPAVPLGPLIQENLDGKNPNRTYTNLLKNYHDEALFEYYLTSTLETVTLDKQRTSLVSASIIYEAIPSPDGEFILLTTLHRPFSYQLPVSYFPINIQVIDRAGKLVYDVVDIPLYLRRTTKFDEVRIGRRRIAWRSDTKATLCWLEALDQGDPTCDVPYRDALFELDAPFTDIPKQLWQSEYRFSSIAWGRADLALVGERWYDTRTERIWRINPQAPETPPQLLFDRSYEDKYADPGSPMFTTGAYTYRVLRFAPDGNTIYLSGEGASPDGAYPFLDSFNLETSEKQRLWQCKDPYYEEVCYLLDDQAQTLITHRQSQTEPANYFLHTLSDSVREASRREALPPTADRSTEIALTNYQDPAPQLAGIYKELVKYQRADGVQLSARLYLPPQYDITRDGPLPMLFWVYPEEFKDREFAGQLTTTANTFSRPSRDSILLLLTQGYAVLAGPTLPIIGEGNTEPNDTYVEQLVAGAQAAVEYVVSRGFADRQHIGIGGHSYGAFTTVNLLAHTDLFRMGIARSGAYNRTLTPFGFQGEQRDFWQAQDTYIHMSPFTHANKVKAPLLLIHGENDSNAGTYPLQTERLYDALKGLGATVRRVILPLENHGYRSREGVGHVLWEMVNWCERYLK